MPKAKITEFSVGAGLSSDYGEVKTNASITLELAEGVERHDVIEVHAEAQKFITELVEKQHESKLDRATAEADREVERLRELRESRESQEQQDDSSDGIEWAQADKPNNNGTFRYRTTDDLGTNAFKAMISQAIRAEGYDPGEHVIYDERVGKWGLESGNTRYSPASVKPAEGTLAYERLTSKQGDKTRTSLSFFVDFNYPEGTVRVKPTDQYLEALENTPSDEADEDTDDELPF